MVYVKSGIILESWTWEKKALKVYIQIIILIARVS